MNAVLLYDANRNPMAVQNGVAIPANTSGILAAGSDGTNARNLAVTATGIIKTAPIGQFVVLGKYGASIGRLAGTAGAQNIASIENPAASGRTIYVSRLSISASSIAAAAVNFQYRAVRMSAVPTGGAAQTAQKRRTGYSSPVAIVRVSPTGGTDVAGTYWASSGLISDANGVILPVPQEVIQPLTDDDYLELAAGEALKVTAEGNDTDINHTVSVSWVEV